MGKEWYKSRTLWLGVATVLGAVVDAIAKGLPSESIVMAAIGVLIVFLRTQTDGPLTK